MIKVLRKLSITVVGTVLFIPALASQADPVIELNELMAKLETLDVMFQLEVRDQSTNELLDESAGELKVKRPGYFYVFTKEPYEQYIISDREVIWTYDVDLEQAAREAVDDRLQQTPFLLLSGDVDAIRQNFSVEEPQIIDDKQQYKLNPLDTQASYNNVVLFFDEADVLNSMSWHNSLGENNAITFSDIKVNQGIPDSQFQFQPPDGVDVEIKNAP